MQKGSAANALSSVVNFNLCRGLQIRVLKEVEYFKDVTVRFGSVLFAVLPSSNLVQHSETVLVSCCDLNFVLVIMHVFLILDSAGRSTLQGRVVFC